MKIQDMKIQRLPEYMKPTVVLTAICLVVALVLAGTYTVTKPIIEEINKATADAARAEVLPEAGEAGFAEMAAGDWTLDGVEAVYEAENGAGTVFTVADKGFGGKLTVMVGVSAEGEITGVKVTKHSETPGLGTKTMEAGYLAQYIGAGAVSLTGGGEAVKIDTITRATISSEAIFRAVELAMKQYAAGVGGGPADGRETGGSGE